MLCSFVMIRYRGYVVMLSWLRCSFRPHSSSLDLEDSVEIYLLLTGKSLQFKSNLKSRLFYKYILKVALDSCLLLVSTVVYECTDKGVTRLEVNILATDCNTFEFKKKQWNRDHSKSVLEYYCVEWIVTSYRNCTMCRARLTVMRTVRPYRSVLRCGVYILVDAREK